MLLSYVFAKSEMIISCSDIILSRYSSVAILFVHRTISRHSAHAALSFTGWHINLKPRTVKFFVIKIDTPPFIHV